MKTAKPTPNANQFAAIKTDNSKPAQQCWPYSVISSFMDYLRVEGGLADNTIIAYRHDLIRFAEYCREKGLRDAQRINAVEMQEYARFLFQLELSTSTIARHLSSVRMFMRFHLLNSWVTQDVCAVLETPKTWKRLPGVLTKQRTMDLLNGVDMNDPLALRDVALLEFLYATGMRASEAAAVTGKAINAQIGYVRCLGKGNKERIIPIHQKALDKLYDYQSELRPELVRDKGTEEIFVSRTGRALNRTEIWRIVKKAVARAGIIGTITPHTLRHCFGSHLLQGGADLRSVQEMLGHANVTTTQIYTHVDHEHLRKVHKKYHPRP